MYIEGLLTLSPPKVPYGTLSNNSVSDMINIQILLWNSNSLQENLVFDQQSLPLPVQAPSNVQSLLSVGVHVFLKELHKILKFITKVT